MSIYAKSDTPVMFVLSNQHVQDYGVRKWAGDDLIELQSEPLSALQALVSPYAPCILTGCELEPLPDGNGDGSPSYRLRAGYVALKGRKTVENGSSTDTDTGADGTENGSGAETAAATAENEDTAASQDEEYVKIVRVTAQTVHQPTVFLTLGCMPVSRAYGNGENKAIAYDYTAEVCDVLSYVGDRPYLALAADADNPRLPDTLGVTRKFDRVGGEAKDVVAGFTLPSVRLHLFSGLKLGTLFGQIQRWLLDLRGLAFKNKVSKTDLTEELAGELGGKVVQEKGKGLSEANFTLEEKLKLDGIKPNANNYSLPLASSSVRGGVKIVYTQSGKNYPVQLSSEKMYVNVPWTDTVYVHPTSAGNKHIPSGGSSGQYLKYSSSGTATWANLPQMTNGGNVSSSFTLYPGVIRKPTANITCYVGKSNEETLKYQNVSYINNTGWCQIKVVNNSGVVVVLSEVAKNRNGNTNNAGLLMFTWASIDIDIVHVHFFEEAGRLA